MFGLLGVYAAILVVVVFIAISLAHQIKLDHRRTQLVMSFVSGIMLGIAVFHLLPHAVYGLGAIDDPDINVDFVALWLMTGLLGMFLLQRLFHFHHHDFDDTFAEAELACRAPHHHSSPALGDGGNIGVFFGLALHSMIDGVALAAAIFADQHGQTDHMRLAGIGVFLAIALHKPLDAITIDMFARQAGTKTSLRKLIVLAYALLCPVVAASVLMGFTSLGSSQAVYIVAALAFSAGIFLCIALSDLLPEIHFHRHDRLSMTLALLAGVAISQAITLIESGASHHLEFHDHHGSTEIRHGAQYEHKNDGH